MLHMNCTNVSSYGCAPYYNVFARCSVHIFFVSANYDKYGEVGTRVKWKVIYTLLAYTEACVSAGV